MSMWDIKEALVANAGNLGNPLEDQTVLDYIFAFIKILLTAAMPFLILAFMVAGLYFIIARGKSDGLNDAKSFFFKLFFYAAIILGAGLLLKILLNLLMDLYNSL